MDRTAEDSVDEFAHFGVDNLLRGRVIVVLRGYQSSDPRHFYTNRKVGWAVGASGRPVGIVQRLMRLMPFDSVAEAHAWMRDRHLKELAPNYTTGFMVEEEQRGRLYLFEPAAWVDVERLKAKIDDWNRRVTERATQSATAWATAESVHPFLIARGVRPRTANRIIRARFVQLLDPTCNMTLLLSPRELDALNASIDDARIHEVD